MGTDTIKRQVLGYSSYILCINIPKGRESCQYCPICKYDHDSDMRRCKATGEILPYFKSEMGDRCPLEIINKEDK